MFVLQTEIQWAVCCVWYVCYVCCIIKFSMEGEGRRVNSPKFTEIVSMFGIKVICTLRGERARSQVYDTAVRLKSALTKCMYVGSSCICLYSVCC